ncbi:transcriptional regulator [Shinella sp.]|uniref:transcriptional regulator n=1 Tax=Shinella sp. TaxID=1870904 RepID=UPI00289BD615|nr:transcriptional regulator [Shinella sp.]
MKKTQRSFSVEYKGRRKPDPKSNSIWGGIDLKSVARDVEDEAAPYPPAHEPDGQSAGNVLATNTETVGPFLTQPVRQHTTEAANEETNMADESETMTTGDAPAVVETPTLPKKQRQPRAKKVAAEPASVGTAAQTAAVSTEAVGKQKRGRKAKAVEAASPAKRKPVKRAPKPVQAASVVSPAIDDIADLLQLEEENQKLRKLLAEKLRAENADLRKRLKLD